MRKLIIIVLTFWSLAFSIGRPSPTMLPFRPSIGEGAQDVKQAEPAPSVMPAFPVISRSVSWAYQHLMEVMDQYHKTFDVYTDVASGGNHFVHRAMLGTGATIDDAQTEIRHSGCTAIKNTFSGSNFGGWYFQNGVVLGSDVQPRPNWGDYPNAGYDLQGATKLTFWVRGENGGEQVEFFAFGVGRDAGTGIPVKPYPDSEAKVTECGRLKSPCYTTLKDEWEQHTIDLAGLDLSYVIGGFGWVTNRSVTFYLDDIRFHGSHLGAPHLLLSYKTICSSLDFDKIHRNAAFTYDNALALIAFAAAGDQGRASMLADAFVYAHHHDLYYSYIEEDVRLRNAYQAGDLIISPGWTPHNRVGTVRLPGWWKPEEQRWYEEREHVGSSTGNLAWVIIALLHYYETWGGSKYLEAATELGDWIQSHTIDTRGAGGYTGGYVGWEPSPDKQLWKSTEHNLDLYVAFERLYQITSEAKWQERAQYARNFVEGMWNDAEGFYWTGTLNDGETVNEQTVPLDAQAWSLLAFGPNQRTLRAIKYAENHHRAKLGTYYGFDFNDDRDMPWSEGTAQMAVVYWVLGRANSAQFYLNQLRKLQATARNGNGKGIVAAPANGLTTGFDWLYYNRLHIGATAWFIFAERRYNPYWETPSSLYRILLRKGE